MDKKLNLCEILKGHEDETFYSPCYGYIGLTKIGNHVLYFDDTFKTDSQGRINDRGECVIFPSKDQRDWNKWFEEQKPKVPKTWGELVKENKYQPYFAEIHRRFSLRDKCAYGKNSVEKSAAALLKIHQLIEVGYGGNVTKRDYQDIHQQVYRIDYDYIRDKFQITNLGMGHIAFHNEKQAKEFLKYEENVQLLKDYFII